MELGLRKKRAIVTGGSRGIGRACALRLAREGVAVGLVARSFDDLICVVRRVESEGGIAHAIIADLREGSGCESAVAEAMEALGGVDILINSAGDAVSTHVLEVTRQEMDDAIGLKVYGYLRMAQLVAPFMAEQGWGRIVSIAGASAMDASATDLCHSLVNSAVLMLTRSLSDALSGRGVLANAVCPGTTNTGRGLALVRSLMESKDLSESDALEEIASGRPAGRLGGADEVALVVAFLASSACSYIHGRSIVMDGGRSFPFG